MNASRTRTREARTVNGVPFKVAPPLKSLPKQREISVSNATAIRFPLMTSRSHRRWPRSERLREGGPVRIAAIGAQSRRMNALVDAGPGVGAGGSRRAA